MIETETSHIDQEPSESYAVGDVVKLRHSSDPETLWLLTTPIKNTPAGPTTGGIIIDKEGNGISADGTIFVEDIKEKVGLRKTLEEVTSIYVGAFESKFGKTLPPEEIIAMLNRQLGIKETKS